MDIKAHIKNKAIIQVNKSGDKGKHIFMKTIVVNFTGRNGGGPQYAYEMTKAFLNIGYKIVAILSSSVENLEKWKKLGLEEIITLKTYKNYFSFFIFLLRLSFVERFKIKKRLKKYKIDYIYIPMEQPASKIINKIIKKPYILTIHDLVPHSGENKIMIFLNNILNFRLRNKADFAVLLSKAFVEQYSLKYIYPLSNVAVCKHGFFNSYLEVQTTPLHFAHIKKINFVFFGRISEYKGIDILLAAYKKIENEFSEISLTIAGSGSLKNYTDLISSCKNVNIFNRWIDDSEITSIFKVPNMVLVLPYKDATQSGVIPLAHMYGVPVVASKTGGLEEQIENFKTGILVQPGSVDSLYEVLYKICISEINLTEIVDFAQKTIMDTWNDNVKIIDNMLESQKDKEQKR